jgi:hypothetical protein
MSNLSQVLVGLQKERKRMQQELRRLEGAIGALKGLATGNHGSLGRTRPRLSVAARRRIAAAQRARWAKVRQEKKAA